MLTLVSWAKCCFFYCKFDEKPLTSLFICSSGRGLSSRVQSAHNNLWNPQEPGGSHFSQLHHLATLRRGETLHWLLQHEQHEVPGSSQTPSHCQGRRQNPTSCIWKSHLYFLCSPGFTLMSLPKCWIQCSPLCVWIGGFQLCKMTEN